MKKKFYILFLLIGIFTTASFHANGQTLDLPMVCAGSVSTYGVVGMGGSAFTWTITDPNGNPIPQKYIKTNQEKVEVTWRDTLPAGIYTFSVLETTVFGCTGILKDPQYIVLNTNEIFIPVDGNQDVFTACSGKSITLDAGYFGNDSRYLWTGYSDSTKQTFITTTGGTYQVRIVDGNSKSCSYDTLRAVFHPLPYVWLGNDTTLFAGQTLELNASDPTFTGYSWYNTVPIGGSPIAISPTLTVDGLSGNKTYTVVVTDINGCENSDNIKVNAADYSNLKIPAAFTPNGDQINDVWVFPRSNVQGDNAELYKYFDNVNVKVDVKVFSRWGKLVWESSSKFKFWDGKDMNGTDLPMDSYHYIIRFIINDKEYDYKGSVTIIR